MHLNLGHCLLDLDAPVVMGILNVTPDSFSDGGNYLQEDAAIERGQQMIEEGASIIDVGGESTRPGAAPVAADEQLGRIVAVIEALARDPGAIISVDTSDPDVIRAATAAGASLVNDVFALRQPGAVDALVSTDAAVCLMHMQGSPATMQDDPVYDDVVDEVSGFLRDRARACVEAGIGEDRLAVDPGFGFGKTDPHNLTLLANLQRVADLGYPLLVGLSRKGTLGRLTGRTASARGAAGLAAAVMAVERGARIVRTHDVAATLDALTIVRSIA